MTSVLSPERIPHDEMASELAKLVYSKATWLADFSHGSRKRPDHEIEQKRRERDVLQQAYDDYSAASERRKSP